MKKLMHECQFTLHSIGRSEHRILLKSRMAPRFVLSVWVDLSKGSSLRPENQIVTEESAFKPPRRDTHPKQGTHCGYGKRCSRKTLCSEHKTRTPRTLPSRLCRWSDSVRSSSWRSVVPEGSPDSKCSKSLYNSTNILQQKHT